MPKIRGFGVVHCLYCGGEPTVLPGGEYLTHITHAIVPQWQEPIRCVIVACADCWKRLSFAEWLVEHGHLSEWDRVIPPLSREGDEDNGEFDQAFAQAIAEYRAANASA